MEEQNEEIVIEVLPETEEEASAAAVSEKGKHSGFGPLTTQSAIIWNAVIIALAIIIGAFIVAHGPFSFGSKDAATGAAVVVSPDIKKVNLSGEPWIGNPTAKVAVAYWSDYQCPFCKQFETTTFQQVVKDYVSTGKVAVVFKDFSFLGPDSTAAALYGRAVWQLYPGQYFAWREAMYNAQDKENSGFGDEASIVKLTGTISGIDAAKVSAAVAANSDAYQKAIDADRDEATKFGIQGTPSFITGTTLIPGVVPYSTFQKDLDAQLAK